MKKAKKKVELLEIYDVEGYQRPSDGGSSSKDKKGGSGSKNGGNAGKVTGSTNKKDSNTGNRGAGGNVTTSSKNSSNNNNNNTLKSSNSNSKNQSNNATLKTATKTAINIAGNFLEGAVGLGSKLLSTTMGETKGNKTVKKVVTTTPTKKVATSPTPKVYNGNDYKSKIVTNTSTNVLDSKLSDPLKGTLKTEMDLKTIVQDSMDIRKVAKKAAQDTGNTKKGTVLDGGGVYKKSVTVGEFKQAEEKQNQKNAIKKQEMDKKLAPYKDSNGGYSLPWQQAKGMDKSTQKMIDGMEKAAENFINNGGKITYSLGDTYSLGIKDNEGSFKVYAKKSSGVSIENDSSKVYGEFGVLGATAYISKTTKLNNTKTENDKAKVDYSFGKKTGVIVSNSKDNIELGVKTKFPITVENKNEKINLKIDQQITSVLNRKVGVELTGSIKKEEINNIIKENNNNFSDGVENFKEDANNAISNLYYGNFKK